MKYSFVIGSIYDKDQRLQRCIGSIEDAYSHCRDCDIEICVVFYNVAKDRVSLNIRYPQKTKIYYVDLKGHAAKRNYAIKRSDADLFIFLDDHAEVKGNFLEVLTKDCMMTDAGAFCGRIVEKETGRHFTACFSDLKKRYLGQFEYKYFMGSSHAVKKTALAKIGLYDESFGLGACYRAAEESDIFFRLKRRGVKILYQPELIFFHPIPGAVLSSKVFNYCYGNGAMLTKQMLTGKKYLFIYLCLISSMLLKSFLRILQGFVAPSKELKVKTARYHYRDVFFGLAIGSFDYLKRTVHSKGDQGICLRK